MEGAGQEEMNRLHLITNDVESPNGQSKNALIDIQHRSRQRTLSGVGDYLIDTDRRRKNNEVGTLEKYHRATGAIIADLILGFRGEKSPFHIALYQLQHLTTVLFHTGISNLSLTLEGLGLAFKATGF